MFPIIVISIVGIYALKLAFDGFARGRIQLSRERKGADGITTPAKYIEGRPAKAVAVICAAVGIAVVIFSISAFQKNRAQEQVVDEVTKGFLEEKN